MYSTCMKSRGMTTESLSAGYKSNLKINTVIMCSNNCDKRI